MARRLPAKDSEWIDRSKKIAFKFEGKEVIAFEGDSITSALIANGAENFRQKF